MSGSGGGLPREEWTRWLLETFTPLVTRVDDAINNLTAWARGADDRLVALEARVGALENAGPGPGPQEPPEEPGEPSEPAEPIVLRPQEWPLNDLWEPRGDHVVAIKAGGGNEMMGEVLELPAGEYALHVRAYAPDDASGAFYAGFGDELARARPATPGRWHIVPVVERAALPAGQHTVNLAPGETGLHVDALIVTPASWQGDLASLLDDPPEVGVPEDPDEPEDPEEPPSGFEDATHRVAPLIDESFDPKAPTLRDGRPLNADQRRLYDAMMRGLLRSDPDHYTSDRMFDRNDSYYIGRHGQVQQQMTLAAMSRTGDARILDELVRRWNLAYKHLVIEWDASNLDDTYIQEWAGARVSNGRWVLSGGRTPWSPYPKWLYGGKAGRAGAGTDLNNLQNIKPWAILTQFLWALETNRDKRSPAGYDYGREADKWRAPLRGFIDAFTIDTDEPWAKNYKGLDGGMLWGKYRSRAKPGQWPFFARGEGHAIYDSALFCFYCALLGEAGWDIPNWQGALAGARMLFEYIRDGMVDSVDSKGKPSIIARSGGAWRAMHATYTNYLGFSQNLMRDIGEWRDLFTDETLLRLSRSYVDMHRPDGTTLKNLAAEVDRTGHGLDVSTGSDRTVHQQVINGFCVGMLWEEGDYLYKVGTAAQESRFGNGYEDAKSHIIPSIQFVRAVAPLVD